MFIFVCMSYILHTILYYIIYKYIIVRIQIMLAFAMPNLLAEQAVNARFSKLRLIHTRYSWTIPRLFFLRKNAVTPLEIPSKRIIKCRINQNIVKY